MCMSLSHCTLTFFEQLVDAVLSCPTLVCSQVLAHQLNILIYHVWATWANNVWGTHQPQDWYVVKKLFQTLLGFHLTTSRWDLHNTTKYLSMFTTILSLSHSIHSLIYLISPHFFPHFFSLSSNTSTASTAPAHS